MLLYSQENPPFAYYRIEKIQQYKAIKQLLVPKIEVVSKLVFDSSPDFLISLIEDNLVNNKNHFALWVGFNTSTNEIITYSTTFITLQETIPICLIHNLWVDPKHYLLLLKKALIHYDKWAAEHGARKMVFCTNHKIDRIESIFKRFNWRLSKVIIEKELD